MKLINIIINRSCSVIIHNHCTLVIYRNSKVTFSMSYRLPSCMNDCVYDSPCDRVYIVHTLVCQINVHARLLILGVKVQPT